MRKFKLGDGKSLYTLLQLAEVTDFTDAEFDAIANLPVGGRLELDVPVIRVS